MARFVVAYLCHQTGTRVLIITGGAIKLTHKMGEREHTLKELSKMEQVRNFLISNQAIDADGFVDFLSELS